MKRCQVWLGTWLPWRAAFARRIRDRDPLMHSHPQDGLADPARVRREFAEVAFQGTEAQLVVLARALEARSSKVLALLGRFSR
jgi:hypothetical protein